MNTPVRPWRATAAAAVEGAILAIQFFDALSRPCERAVAVTPVRLWRATATAAVDSVEKAILAIQFFDSLSRLNVLLLSLLLGVGVPCERAATCWFWRYDSQHDPVW